MVTAGESIYRRYQDQPMCARTELFRQESVGRRVFFDFVDPSLNPVSLLNVSSALAHESCIKGCNLRERRSVKIHTCCRQ